MPTPLSNLLSNRSCDCEIVTLIFATIKLVLLTLGVVGGIAEILVTNTETYSYRDGRDQSVQFQWILSVPICGFLLLFTALLFHGVLKRRAGYISAYCVFGVAMLFLTNFGIVAFATFLNRPDYSPFPPFPHWNLAILATVVIGQVVYAIILDVIFKTYRKIKEINKILDEHQQILVDEIADEQFSEPV